METHVINIFGSPGAGKSTLAADLFFKLKMNNVNCELVGEFAKDLVWEKRDTALLDQLYILGQQHLKLFRLKDKVQIIITDCPLLLNIIYNELYSKKSSPEIKQFDIDFKAAVKSAFNLYNNINVYINRAHSYEPVGRVQTESESVNVDLMLKNLLEDLSIPYTIYHSNDNVSDKIKDFILNNILNERGRCIYPLL